MLKYNGRGFLHGIPARDLTPKEAEKYGGVDALVQSGLYEIIESKPKKQQPPQTRQEVDYGGH